MERRLEATNSAIEIAAGTPRVLERREMIAPVRLQLSRAKGFRLQEHSRAINGLDAVNVARPSIYGNPFVIGSNAMPWLAMAFGYRADRAGQRRAAIALYRAWVGGRLILGNETTDSNDLIEYDNGVKCPTSDAARMHAFNFANMYDGFAAPDSPKDFSPLRGKNLGCFCRLEDQCHADILLEISNKDAEQGPTKSNDM